MCMIEEEYHWHIIKDKPYWFFWELRLEEDQVLLFRVNLLLAQDAADALLPFSWLFRFNKLFDLFADRFYLVFRFRCHGETDLDGWPAPGRSLHGQRTWSCRKWKGMSGLRDVCSLLQICPQVITPLPTFCARADVSDSVNSYCYCFTREFSSYEQVLSLK